MGRESWGVEIPGGFFDEVRHLYRCEAGIIRPSTTQVFSLLGCSADLSMVKKADLEWKQGFGNAFHAASEYLAADNLDWDTLDEEIIPAVTGIEQFFRKIGYEHEAGEEARVHSIHGMKYGLRPDLRGSMSFQTVRRKAVIDLKTGARYDKTWDWQLGGYLHPHPGYMGVIARVDPDGTVEPFYLKDAEAAKREFQVLLGAAILKLNNGMGGDSWQRRQSN